MRIALIDIDGSGEAHLLRLQLEAMGADVAWHGIGRPSAFFEAFTCFGAPADIAVISGHGDEGGLVFPAMADGVDPLVLPGDRMTPAIIGARLGVVPPIIVSTACDTGHREFAEPFFAKGCRTYVAPSYYPDATSVPVLLGLAFYRVLHSGASWSGAIKAANTFFTLENGFVVHTA